MKKNCHLKKWSSVFSLTPSSSFSAEGRSGWLLLCVSSGRFSRSVSDLRSRLPNVPLDFRCYGDWERVEQCWSLGTGTASPRAAAVFFSFLLTSFLFTFGLSQSIGISLCTGKIHICHEQERGQRARLQIDLKACLCLHLYFWGQGTALPSMKYLLC